MSELDYRDRPSKAVTRRILVATLRRLQAFQSLERYPYVGFGAVHFVDFDLMHRQLGVVDMTSIEGRASLVPRCHFNRPYRGIVIREGTSSTVLPTLDWSLPAIVHLDYTQRLRSEELSDIKNLAMQLQPGSVLAISLNCQPNRDEALRRSDLESAVGPQLVPLGVTGVKLGGWGLASVQRDIVTSTVDATLSGRGDATTWQQLLNIRYKDGASMQTIAGVVDHPGVHDALKACRFEDMPEVRTGSEALEIRVPVLTTRERLALNQKIPGTPGSLPGLAAEEIEAYVNNYRWLNPTS